MIMQQSLFRISLTLLAAALLLCSAPVMAATSDDQLDAEVDQIFSSLMSPFCPGKLLRDCSSSSASELKAKVHERLKNGETAQQVSQSLLALYGEGIRAAPPVSGFGIFAWLTPFAFLAAGLILFLLWLRTRGAMAEDSTAEALPGAALPDGELPKTPEKTVRPD